ncbi:MAG: hypothetical protein A2V98_12470 [Planctomycetes bacterium RBG_16_64_12]|nr:MAG: hypothetical protein A2V98_12470 [Planctomycetes bacterium RBG_16_64_12]
MVIVDLAAVDVLPALIDEPSVGQGPRRVVVLQVGGDRVDVLPVGTAAVHHRHFRQPALHPTLAAAGDEHDVAVGQIGRLDVVEGPVGQTPEAGPVDVDLIEVIILRPAGAIGEKDSLAVVMDLGISHRAFRIVDK